MGMRPGARARLTPWLLAALLALRCSGVISGLSGDVPPAPDAGPLEDAGTVDAGGDGGSVDSGAVVDAGPPDAGASDAGPVDAGDPVGTEGDGDFTVTTFFTQPELTNRGA